jgi:hypothetical protein
MKVSNPGPRAHHQGRWEDRLKSPRRACATTYKNAACIL